MPIENERIRLGQDTYGGSINDKDINIDYLEKKYLLVWEFI